MSIFAGLDTISNHGQIYFHDQRFPKCSNLCAHLLHTFPIHMFIFNIHSSQTASCLKNFDLSPITAAKSMPNIIQTTRVASEQILDE